MIDRYQEDNSTLPISENGREVVTRLKEHNLLSMGKGEMDINNKDIYLLAVALGLDSPAEKLIKPESWVRMVNFRDHDKALAIAAYMATALDSDSVGKYCDQRDAFAYCKQFTDAGFRIIDSFASDAMYDPDLMVKKMLSYVDSIYEEVISSV